MKNLVIVESPAKGKTIEKFLGKDFTAKASFGHIRDLPKKSLGIEIENNFKPTYEIDAWKKKVINELKKMTKGSDKIWIATDEDREWEAIWWHLCGVLDLDPNSVNRIVFHEITKSAIENAIKTPRHIDMDLVKAQQARRLLDRIVWFKVSPILWKKIRKWLSAWRVQSVAVKLIVEREREIQNFKSEENWKIKAKLEAKWITFYAELLKIDWKWKKIVNKDDVKKILATLGIMVENLEDKKDKKWNIYFEIPLITDFKLVSADKKDSIRTPQAPFTTSTLQQEASRKLDYWVSQTMTIAQNLYQNWYITYMRTDSVNLSDLAISTSIKFIEETFWKEYAVSWGRKYKNKQANAQEAHEAIRPAYIDKTPENVWLNWNDLKLYKLIWERTIASQMKEAIIETTTYIFNPEIKTNQDWISKWEVIKFPGFMKLYIEWSDDEESQENGTCNLPKLQKWDIVKTKNINSSQTFSKPPSRYTEAMLVKKLESEWIGRPSTYAPTIATIIERWYIEKIEKKLAPTEIAFVVVDFLEKYFVKMMDYKFTAKLEDELDEIAKWETEWTKMLEKFYTYFKTLLDNSMENATKVTEEVGKKCPTCGSNLVYKFSKNGKFIGCSNYPDCKYLENIIDEDKEKYIQELKVRYEWKPCEAWWTIVVKNGKYWPFLSSSLYPEVKWIGKIPNKQNDELEQQFWWENCDKCWDGIMHVKNSRRWPFLACNNYPECKNAKNLPKKENE